MSEDTFLINLWRAFNASGDAFSSLITKYKCRINKDENDNHYLDLYFSKYLEKYNNVHKFFISELKRIYEGKETRSDILLINLIEFTTKNAYGDNDDVVYKIELKDYRNIKEFDGNYILSFNAKIKEKDDLIRLVYDKKSAEKFENKTARDERKTSVKFNDIEQEDELKKKNDEFYKQYKALFDELEDD